MPLPDSPRIIYQKNPLDKVVCQLRFPPILKIDSEVPSAFQDRIRNTFPLYLEKTAYEQEIFIGPGIASPQPGIQQFNSTPTKQYIFLSADKSCHVVLTRTFVSLSVKDYKKWEEFRKNLENPFNALIDIYKPPFFTRIGLRYIDIIDRSRLGLVGTDWKELLKPHLLGFLATELEKEVNSFNNTYVVGLEDGNSQFRMAASYARNSINNEQCVMIDSDFYTPKRLDPVDVFEKLDFLHKRASRLIKWIITDKLHSAMEPIEI